MENKKKALFILPIFAVLLTMGAFSAPISSEQVLETKQVLETQQIDRSTVTGHVILKVFDTSTGKLKFTSENHNLVVDVGLDEIAEAVHGVGGVGTTLFDFLEIGTSATAPLATNVALGSSACARIQDVAPDVNSAISGETSVSIISSFDGATCAGAIVEAGVFNGLAGGEMLARSTFGIVTIGSGDTLNVNYTLTYT